MAMELYSPVEIALREEIIKKYGTVKEFSKQIGIPNTSIAGVLKRGVNNSGITTVINICKGLRISTDALADGNIVYLSQFDSKETELSEVIYELKTELDKYTNIRIMGADITEDEKNFILDSLDMAYQMIMRARNRKK